jgi:hypothetical protein
VSEASRYHGASGERSSEAADSRSASLGLGAAGSPSVPLPLPLPLPVRLPAAGRAGGRAASRRESSSAEAAEYFHVEASAVEVALDLGSAPISPLFVREALRLLPESPGEPGALERAKE